jgi:hypothetical protein
VISESAVINSDAAVILSKNYSPKLSGIVLKDTVGYSNTDRIMTPPAGV